VPNDRMDPNKHDERVQNCADVFQAPEAASMYVRAIMTLCILPPYKDEHLSQTVAAAEIGLTPCRITLIWIGMVSIIRLCDSLNS